MSAPDTFPKRLLEHARLRRHRTANHEKDYGIWQSWTWAQIANEVEAFGRLHHGLQKRVELGLPLSMEPELLLLD